MSSESDVDVIFQKLVISNKSTSNKPRRKEIVSSKDNVKNVLSEITQNVNNGKSKTPVESKKNKKPVPKQKTQSLENEVKKNEKNSSKMLSSKIIEKVKDGENIKPNVDKDGENIKPLAPKVTDQDQNTDQQKVEKNKLKLVKSNETPKKVGSPKTPIVIPSTKTSRLRAKKATSDSTLDTSYHKITDFFTQRRSERKLAKKAEEDKQIELQLKITQGCEEGLKIEDFPEKGRGVITTKNFTKGDFVVEYVGDLIDLPTAKRREKRYLDNSNVGCYMYYFQHRNKTHCIDATAESGKLGRLINHSRKGNLISRVIEIDLTPRLVFFAKDDIETGVEVLYDYGDRSKESLKSHPWLKL